jgi:tetratricopeptide (TPR) repeat protein
LISDRLEDLKSMPANFMERRDPFLDIDRGTIVKTLLGGTDKKAIEDQVHLDLLRLELEHQHASLLRQQGLSSVAKSIYERITEEQESLFGERHLISARAKEGLAMSLFDLKKYREAVQYHNGAISVVEERLGSSHHELRRLRNNLAISFAKLKMLNDSEALFQSLSPDLIEIINSVKKQSPPDEKQISVSEKKEPLPSGEDSLYMMCNRVVLAYLRGGHEKARSALLILQEKMNDLFEERNPGPLICDYNMAVILAAHGQSMYPEAKAKFRKSLADLKALLGDKHPISQEALANFSLFDKLIVPDELVHGMSQLKLDIATASAPPSLVRLPQPILMQLEERFTPKRGTSLIDPEWFNELKERFKEKPEDIIGGKEKQM